jgi:hypothetical protein
LLRNSILNLDFIETQTGQDAVRLNFVFARVSVMHTKP